MLIISLIFPTNSLFGNSFFIYFKAYHFMNHFYRRDKRHMWSWWGVSLDFTKVLASFRCIKPRLRKLLKNWLKSVRTYFQKSVSIVWHLCFFILLTLLLRFKFCVQVLIAHTYIYVLLFYTGKTCRISYPPELLDLLTSINIFG